NTNCYFQSLSMTKYASLVSPVLVRCIHKQEVIAEATLTSVNKNQTITYKLKDVMVTNVSTGGSGGESNLTENIILDFKSIEMFYDNHLDERKRQSTSTKLENFNYGKEVPRNRRY
ncbi:MAG: type VI secretion system tube protein Hcp, partial [Bdellovibrionales bacterium]|nr:type VI secretion system tube protein Hcp [Bdellovibrionales bacterium]